MNLLPSVGRWVFGVKTAVSSVGCISRVLVLLTLQQTEWALRTWRGAVWVSPEPTALMFVGEKGDAVRPGVWQKEWDRARGLVGLGHLHLHDLRHVAGTLAAATGAGTKEIMRRLGHATQSAALRYQHATDERDRVLANGIDRLIQAARAEPDATVVPLHSPEEGAASPGTG